MSLQPINEHQNVQDQQASVPAPLNPVPMSFPAALLNPKNKTIQAVKQREVEGTRPSRGSASIIDGKARGKRYVRRIENVTFRGNPHIVQPARTDYQISPTDIKTTFPQPLPPYLPRASPAPSGAIIRRSEPGNINSAYAGRFTLGLRGVRRDLRQRGGARTRGLISDIEGAIQSWLDGDDSADPGDDKLGTAIDRNDPPSILQVSATPLEIVWRTEDPFARWIIHCVSRWHGIVSFSKDIPVSTDVNPQGVQRETHLLRPNSRHPDPRAAAAIYTPTATDLESSIIDTEGSDYGGLADSITSLQIVESSDVVEASTTNDISGVPLQNTEIKEESEGAISDADSSFSLIDHPEEEGSQGEPEQITDNSARPIRTLERVEGIGFQPANLRIGRSDSSPSRSPMRARRLRHNRRMLAPPRRSQAFRSVDPPTSFMAYVYGSAAVQ
ncbi:hypothetical protein CPB86DRAFT_794245 [Serendipita vermifera]|nr:hypothetical protein CPB86DRAFT_794245 [Serendipita vermifera]